MAIAYSPQDYSIPHPVFRPLTLCIPFLASASLSFPPAPQLHLGSSYPRVRYLPSRLTVHRWNFSLRWLLGRSVLGTAF